MDRQSLLKTFDDNEERLLFAKTLDAAALCEKRRINTFTDFLDPIKASKFLSAIRRTGYSSLNSTAFGGADFCERQIIGFSYDKSPIEKKEFPISIIQIKHNSHFVKQPTHRDYLGSILGLGIVRCKIGDIVISEGKGAFVFVFSDICGYICANLERVGKAAVSIEECGKVQYEELVSSNGVEQGCQGNVVTVSSLRVDNIISAGFHLSRSCAAKYVDGEKVFINWSLCTSASKQLNGGDVVTVRGIGRLTVNEILGKSKKDKFKIDISVSGKKP